MRRLITPDTIYSVLRISQVWAAHLTLTTMVAALTLQIVAREFQWQVDWTEELSRFAFVAMVFVSASYATQMNTHLGVTAFVDMITKWRPISWVVEKLQFLAILTFDVAFFWLCLENLKDGIRFANKSPALGFNENLLLIAPLFGFGAAIIFHLMTLFFERPSESRQTAQDGQP